jgi:hypothetical protein
MALASSFGVPHTILVVDDEATILFAMGEYFTTQGAEVDYAQGPLLRCGHRRSLPGQMGPRARPLDPDHHPDGLRVGRDRAGGPPAGASAFLRKPLPLSEIATTVFDLIRSPTGRPGLPEACGAPPGGVPSPDPEARDRRILPSP